MSSAQYSYKRDPKLSGYPNITIPNDLINRIDSAVKLAVRELETLKYWERIASKYSKS